MAKRSSGTSTTIRQGKRGTSITTRSKVGNATITKTQGPSGKIRTTYTTRVGNITRSSTV
jgi:hypothetical protein